MKRLLYILCAVVLMACSESKEIELSADNLETAFEQGFPYEHNQGLVKVTVNAPDINLEGGRIHFDFPISTRGLIKKSGNVLVSGKIVYKQEEGALYVQESRVEEILFDKKNDELQKYKKMYTNVADNIIQDQLNENPVYTFDEEGIGSFSKNLLKDVRTEGDKLIVEVGL